MVAGSVQKSPFWSVSAIHKSLHDYWRPEASRPSRKIVLETGVQKVIEQDIMRT